MKRTVASLISVRRTHGPGGEWPARWTSFRIASISRQTKLSNRNSKCKSEKRDVFLLFWSRHARDSRWVLWEFETARAKRGMDAILPMPLEDPTLAPPPPGFEDKHLRDRFMIAGYGLKKIAALTDHT